MLRVTGAALMGSLLCYLTNPWALHRPTHIAQALHQYRSPLRRNNTGEGPGRTAGSTPALQKSRCKGSDRQHCCTLVLSCSLTQHTCVSATLQNFPLTSGKRKNIYGFSSSSRHIHLKIAPDIKRGSPCWFDRLQGPAVRLLTSQKLSA